MDLAHDAIQAALQNDWLKAIELNEKIYNADNSDIGAILRLAHAYFEHGNAESSQQYAQKALTLDPANKLALKCIEKCSVGKHSSTTTSIKKANLKAFLEIPGKTRFVHLVQLGEPKLLTSLFVGANVVLEVNRQKVSILTEEHEYVGKLPDDIASKIGLSKANNFWAAIKYAGPTEVSIVLHEK